MPFGVAASVKVAGVRYDLRTGRYRAIKLAKTRNVAGPAGRLHGELVVSMRPVPADRVAEAAEPGVGRPGSAAHVALGRAARDRRRLDVRLLAGSAAVAVFDCRAPKYQSLH